MRTMGLIGGMSWESSLEYYRLINEAVKEKLGKHHSAKCILYSVDFEEVEQLQHEGQWGKLSHQLVRAAQTLEMAGADCLLICANTMHKLANDVESSINIPLIHIADVVGYEINEKGMKTVGLLGTRFTMEEDFYIKRLKERYNIEILTPEKKERDIVHDVVYNELVMGNINEKSRKKFKKIIKNLQKKGAQGVILGCTEIPLLVRQEDVDIPLFDTTSMHAKAAVEYALSQER